MTTPPIQEAPPGGEAHMIRPYAARAFTVERARNAELWTTDGRRLIDLGGASQGTAVLGHAHPRVAAAIGDQAQRGMHLAQTIPTPTRARFLERLHSLLPDALERTFLCNSGTEAVEAALKLAHTATGRSRFLAAVGGFHGRTLGALALTHKPAFRKPFQAIVGPTVDHLPYPRAGSGDDVLSAWEDAITDDVAAVVLEPVQGEGGIHPIDPSLLRRIQDLAHDHGSLLVLDEVQTGVGRTGAFLAQEHAGIIADIVTLGKALAGGVPVGACVTTADIADRLPAAGHGSTFGGNPLACAAGNAALEALVEERIVERGAHLGQTLRERLRGLDAPIVRETRGQGMMLGIDLRIRPGAVLQRLEEAGYLALSAGTTTVRLLPPLTIEEEHLDGAVAALTEALATGGPAAPEATP